jgi:hypothetical protein
MNCISDAGRQKAVVSVVNEVLLEFVRIYGIGICETNEFGKFFSAFCKSRLNVKFHRLEAGKNVDHDASIILSSSMEWSYSSLPLYLWTKILLTDKDWLSNKSVLHIMDLICKIAFLYQYDNLIRQELAISYRHAVNVFIQNTKSSSKFSLRDTVGTVVSMASSITEIYSSFPSLIPVNYSTDWLSALPPTLWNKPFAERDLVWYGYQALYVETMEEFDWRQQLGILMIQDPNVPLATLGKESCKPVPAFSIYRWALQILETPPSHPAMPILFQVYLINIP